MLKLPKIDSTIAKNEIIKFLKEIANETKNNGFVIGLSGGIDSTIVAYLLKETFDPKTIYSYHLYSSTTLKEDTADARMIAKLFGINYKEIAIDDITNDFLKIENKSNNVISNKLAKNKMNGHTIASEETQKIAEGNFKARIRMSILYYFANLKNCLVAGTGNRSELLIGYFTKYGDGACDFEPIGDIYKTQLKELAKEWTIPKEIVEKPPRAGLWNNQSDEDEIGISYDILDELLYLIIDKKLDNESILKNIDISISEINRIRDKVANNQHKLYSPTSPFASKKLFK